MKNNSKTTTEEGPKGFHFLRLKFPNTSKRQEFLDLFLDNINERIDKTDKERHQTHENWKQDDDYNYTKLNINRKVIHHTENNEIDLVIHIRKIKSEEKYSLEFIPYLRGTLKVPDEDKVRLHISRLVEQIMKYHDYYKSCELKYSKI